MEAEAAMALPNDLLADVLGRLPARSLAASQRVCKAWRDLVDEWWLLLRLRCLLPHSLRGLFINYQNYQRAPPSTAGSITSRERERSATAVMRSWITVTASSSTGTATRRCCMNYRGAQMHRTKNGGRRKMMNGGERQKKCAQTLLLFFVLMQLTPHS